MKVNILPILFFILMYQVQVGAQELTNSAHAQAVDFGKSMVEAYFNNNCTKIYSHLATNIMNMESGEQVQKNTLTAQQFCTKNPVRTDIETSYKAYLSNYIPEALTHFEFAEMYPELQAIYQLRSGDFYFNGANLRNGTTAQFKSADMLTFILRKLPNSNKFQIIAM